MSDPATLIVTADIRRRGDVTAAAERLAELVAETLVVPAIETVRSVPARRGGRASIQTDVDLADRDGIETVRSLANAIEENANLVDRLDNVGIVVSRGGAFVAFAQVDLRLVRDLA